MEYIHSTNPYNPKYVRLNYINCHGEFKFPVNNQWKRIFTYDEQVKSCVVLDSNFDTRIMDEDGNFIKNLKWHDLSQNFGDGLIAGIKDGQEGYYDSEGRLVIPVKFHDRNDINMIPRFNSGVLPCRIVDGHIEVYGSGMSSTALDWAIIDTQGNLVVSDIRAEFIEPFSENVLVMYIRQDGIRLSYLIRRDGRILTKEPFDSIQPSVNGYCRGTRGGKDYLISSNDGTAYECIGFK